MNSSITAWDDIRIIPSYGSYTSIPFSLADNSILEWGTISGTVTIPTTANSVSETVMFETSTDGGTNFSSSGLGGGAILESPSQSILYRVNLSSIDLDYSETPVLEDVTLTFLKPNNVRTVYYKQIAE